MEKEKKTNWRQLSVRMPEEVHRAMKVQAAVEGKSMALILEQLIRDYLNKGGRS